METIAIQATPVISTKSNFSLAPSEVSEYLLLLSPEGNAREEAINAKKIFSYKYQNPDAIYRKPHITLANYIQPNITEDKIISQLEIVGKNAKKIKVVLKNYQWFEPHTIYINVEYQVDIKQLVRKIATKINRLFIIDKNFPPRFISTPHLTLCKDLTIEQYEKSRLEYVNKQFSAEFIAAEMILLKRPIGTKKYQEIGRFRFGGDEIFTSTLQGFLF